MDDAGTRMRDFWDDRAREDAFHFVDPRETYGQADEERGDAHGTGLGRAAISA